jgi:pimeloyl-ACP methyl ester carboxylesterase
MPLVKIEGNLGLYYEDLGSGPPVLFVHGFSGTHALWETQVAALRNDYRCITIDLRGHGWSDKPAGGYTIERNARDVHAFLAALGVERPTYVGFSMGASIGLGLMALYGNIFERMVLVGGTPCWGRLADFEHGHPQDLISQWIEQVKANRASWSYAAARQMFHREPDPMLRMWIWNQSMMLPLHAAIEAIEDSRRADLRPALARFEIPVAIFHGRHDAMDYFAAGEYMARTIKGATLVAFEESGHACFLEEPARFTEELRRFLTRGG